MSRTVIEELVELAGEGNEIKILVGKNFCTVSVLDRGAGYGEALTVRTSGKVVTAAHACKEDLREARCIRKTG